MSNIFKYETAEEAKKAIMSVILSKDWKDTLCKDKNGNEIEYYFDRRAIAKIAQTVPAGMFESQEICDNLLLNCLLDNVDAAAVRNNLRLDNAIRLTAVRGIVTEKKSPMLML